MFDEVFNLLMITMLIILMILIIRIRTIAPEENCPPVRIGVCVKFRISFRVWDNQAIAPEENCPLG